MNHSFTVADATSGRIKRVGTCSLEQDLGRQAGRDEFVINGTFDGELWYIEPTTRSPVSRPEIAVNDVITLPADGRPGAALKSLPPGTRVVADGRPFIVDDGVFEVSAAVPMTLRIEVEPPFPFRSARMMVVFR